MPKKRIMIASDGPYITTGYGMAANGLGKYLFKSDEFDIAFLSFQHQGEPVYHKIGEDYFPVYEGVQSLSMERAFRDWHADLCIHIRDAFAHTPKFFQAPYSLMSLKKRPPIVLWSTAWNSLLITPYGTRLAAKVGIGTPILGASSEGDKLFSEIIAMGRRNDKMLRVHTESGALIDITPNTPLPVNRSGSGLWILAESLAIGDKLFVLHDGVAEGHGQTIATYLDGIRRQHASERSSEPERDSAAGWNESQFGGRANDGARDPSSTILATAEAPCGRVENVRVELGIHGGNHRWRGMDKRSNFEDETLQHLFDQANYRHEYDRPSTAFVSGGKAGYASQTSTAFSRASFVDSRQAALIPAGDNWFEGSTRSAAFASVFDCQEAAMRTDNEIHSEPARQGIFGSLFDAGTALDSRSQIAEYATKGKWEAITGISEARSRDVVSIATAAGTYYANGILTHNTAAQTDNYPDDYITACNKEADMVVTFTEWSRDELAFQGVPTSRLEFAYIGIDSSIYHPINGVAAGSDTFRKKYKYAPGKFMIGSVGVADQARKNYPAILTAAAEAKKLGVPDIDVYLHTSPDIGHFLLPHHAKLVGMNGSVIYPQGYSRTWGRPAEEMAERYSCLDMYVSASMAEGYGVPPVEAMACGTPVIATDMPNFREIMGDGAFAYPKTRKDYPTSWCYSDDTRLFTKDGLKSYWEIKDDTEFATLNGNGELEYQRATAQFLDDYSGEMLQFGGGPKQTYDLLVTPNHKMLVRDKFGWQLTEAWQLIVQPLQSYCMKRDASWVGISQEFFELPVVESSNHWRLTQIQRVPLAEWLDFFGFWIAEGSTSFQSDGGYRVCLTNTDTKKLEHTASIVKNWGFSPNISGKDMIFNSKQVFSYLQQFGHAHDKFIPDNIKNLSKANLQILLHSMAAGDGHFAKFGHEKPTAYYTSSWRLAQDVLEIGLKCGYGVAVREFQSGFSGDTPKYQISFSHRNLQPRNMHSVKALRYKGKIWCVTVPNHTLLAERNGKLTWSGNSYEYLVDPVDMGEQIAKYYFLTPEEKLAVKMKGLDRVASALSWDVTIKKWFEIFEKHKDILKI